MHDPDVVIFNTRHFVTVWHREPGGRDSGTVCPYAPHKPSLHSVLWLMHHWRHLWIQILPVEKCRHYFERCADCNQRMLRSTRIGTSWDAPGVVHSWCHALRRVQGQCDDMTACLLGIADWNQQWRVEYRLKSLKAKEPHNVETET